MGARQAEDLAALPGKGTAKARTSALPTTSARPLAVQKSSSQTL